MHAIVNYIFVKQIIIIIATSILFAISYKLLPVALLNMNLMS